MKPIRKFFDSTKKNVLRVLLLVCGLNVFTACYGMPPEEWQQPIPDEPEQTKVLEDQPDEENTSVPLE